MSDRPAHERVSEPPVGGGSSGEDELICVARIARPQGHRGEVIADLLTDFPERFARLGSAIVKFADGQVLSLKLENSRMHKGRVVLKFSGYDSMTRADDLRGARVMITRDQLVKLPDDTYYDFDLIGCEVDAQDGRRIGRVEEVQNFGAAPLLVVRDGLRELLVPLVLSICVEIDTERKRIMINPPEGLLEL